MTSTQLRRARRPRRPRGGQSRRGAVAAQLAICLTTLIGFMALSIDVGHMYNARAELQRTADAAALAAAAALGDWTTPDPKQAARDAAQTFATANVVAGSGVGLASSDVVFGTAYIDEDTGKYVFTPDPNETYPNAVSVIVRRTEDAPSGPLSLYFANALGISSANVGARATAVLTPRDISFVLDLSTSHNDDSQLRSFKHTTIANKEVYDWLTDTASALDPQTDSLGFQSEVSLTDNGDGTSRISIALTSVSTEHALSHVTFGLPPGAQAMVEATAATDGSYDTPEWGLDPTTGVTGLKFDAVGDGLGEDGEVETHTFSFTVNNSDLAQCTVATKAGTGVDNSISYNLDPKLTIGNLREWGNEVTGPSWSFSGDPGLVRLARYSGWSLTSSWASQTMQERGFGTYTTSETTAINSNSYDSDISCYRRRVLVALGVYRWKSGKSGGQSGGDGDNKIESGEVELMIPYPSDAENPDTLCKEVGGSWDSFVDYVKSSSSTMCKYDPGNDLYGDSGLQYRYGLKTFVDYLLDTQYGDGNSPGLAGSPQQPMGAVADAVLTSLGIIEGLQGGDLVGLASYGTVGYGPAEKPNNMSWLRWFNDLGALRDRVNQLQPGMWTSNTNVAQGIDKGVGVLFDSAEARPNAAKVLLLLTDGIANQVRQNPTYWNESEAKQDAKDAAADARARGVRIYTISVGANADQDLMKSIADLNYDPDDPDYVVPNHFHAEGTIEDYQAELEEIFQKLGGERPVVLIE